MASASLRGLLWVDEWLTFSNCGKMPENINNLHAVPRDRHSSLVVAQVPSHFLPESSVALATSLVI